MNTLITNVGFRGIRELESGSAKSTVSGYSIDGRAQFIEIRDEDSKKNLKIYGNEDGDLVILNKDREKTEDGANIVIPRFLPRQRVGEINQLLETLDSQNPEARTVTLFDTALGENYPLKSDRSLMIFKEGSLDNRVTLCFNNDGSGLRIKRESA
jgi:hypothetical protein